MSFKTKILNVNWWNGMVYTGFVSIVARLYMENATLQGNSYLARAFRINTEIFFWIAIICYLFVLWQEWTKFQIKKILKENNIAVI